MLTLTLIQVEYLRRLRFYYLNYLTLSRYGFYISIKGAHARVAKSCNFWLNISFYIREKKYFILKDLTC